MRKMDLFFIYSNPLFWVAFILFIIYCFFEWIFKGIKFFFRGWWFYFVTLNKNMDIDKLKMLVDKNEHIQKSNFNFYVKWFWRFCTKKIKVIIEKFNST